jgi:glycosyltransferase involved in cell wall biosynthesis
MKICFWGNIGRAMDGKTDGGGELQIAFIARALASCGHEIVVVDYNTRESYTTAEGIKVLPISNWNKGLRVVRTITHRLPGLYSTLMEQNADIYYCRIRDFRHIIAWMVSRRLKAKFILHLASDLDAMNLKGRVKGYYMAQSANLWWLFSGIFIEFAYPFLLRHADLVLVQHTGQRDILLRKKIRSRVFLNIIDITLLPEPTLNAHRDFIYVGWLDKRKGFPDFYKLVERAPTRTYRIVGEPRDDIGRFYYNKLKAFPNVKLMGVLSHYETLRQISGSKALISTSPSEGFPNVFLEAWAYGIPVISLNIDPGSVIENRKLGTIAHGNMNVMLQSLDDKAFNEEFAHRAMQYIEENHALTPKKVTEINTIFTELRYGQNGNS